MVSMAILFNGTVFKFLLTCGEAKGGAAKEGRASTLRQAKAIAKADLYMLAGLILRALGQKTYLLCLFAQALVLHKV